MTQPEQAKANLQPDDSVSDLHRSLTELLRFVCTNTEWEYGESWIPNENYQILELSPAYSLSDTLDFHRVKAWTQFQMCSKSFVLHAGEGLPGRVWQSQQAQWIGDASSETYFLRNQIAQAFGVRAGFGIPILAGSKVLAVAVFFISEARPEDTALIEETQTAVTNFMRPPIS